MNLEKYKYFSKAERRECCFRQSNYDVLSVERDENEFTNVHKYISSAVILDFSKY